MKLAFLAFALLVGCSGCEPTKPAILPDRWKDAPAGAECTDACGCAGENLKAVCPKLYRDAQFWAGFCQAMIDGGVPICAIRLSSVQSCAEAESVCR